MSDTLPRPHPIMHYTRDKIRTPYWYLKVSTSKI